MPKKDSTDQYHAVRALILHTNYQDPHLQNYEYAFIVSTFPKYLHLMKFIFCPYNDIPHHYIYRNPAYPENKMIKIGHLFIFK